MWQQIKPFLFGAIAIFFVFKMCFSGGDDTEYTEVPTQGLITTVAEVKPEKFLIDDEVVAPTPEESRIIAKYLDGKIDTFTLDQARLMQASGGDAAGMGMSPLAGMAMTAAGAGLLGYMMGRSMRTPPSQGAYRNPQTYNRVNNTAGNSLRQSANRVSRPSGGSKGFGGGRSTRSVGG